MAKTLGIIGVVLLILLLVVGGLAAYAVGTENGLRQVLSLAQKKAPGELKWEVAQGSLSGPLEIENLSYHQEDGLELQLNSAGLHWQPGQILSKRLHINSLKADGVEIHLPPVKDEEKPDEPFKLPEIDLPLSFQVDELDLTNIQIYPHGATEPIVIEQLKLTAVGEGNHFQLLDFKFESPEADATIKGSLQPTGNYPMDIDLDWLYRHAEFGAFEGGGKVTGDLANLRLDHAIDGAANVILSADVKNVLKNPQWDADITLESNNLGVFNAQLKDSPLKAKIHSKGGLSEFKADGELSTKLEQTGATHLDFNLLGSSKKINLKQVLLTFVGRPGQIQLSGNIDLITLLSDVQGEWKELGWPLVGDAEYKVPYGTLNFKGTPQKYQVELKTDLNGDQLGPLQLSADVQGTEKAVNISSLSLFSKESDLKLNIKGDFKLKDQAFNADGDWQSLNWPMSGEPQVESAQGNFKASGKITDYQFTLSTDLKGPNIPQGNWKLSGKGSDKALSEYLLIGELLEGNLQSSGQAAWLPQVNWDVELAGNELNPGVQWPDAKGKLNLKLTSVGKLTDEGPELAANIAQLSGKLRDQPIRGAGQVEIKGKVIDLKALRVSSGDARLKLNGHLGDTWDVDWEINAKDLGQLLPDFKGSVSGKGQLLGTAEKPRTKFNINIADLFGAGIKIKQLKGRGDIDVAGGRASSLDLKGKTLELAGNQWREFSLAGSGVPKKHQVKLDLDGELAQLETSLKGGFEEQQWRGTLNTLSARKTEFGDWVLEHPADFLIDKSSAEAKDLCLKSLPTRLCVTGSWNQKTGSKGELKLSALEPKRFQKFMPPGMSVETQLDGKINGSMSTAGEPNAVLAFKLKPGQLKMESDTDPIVIELREGLINATVKGDKVDSDLFLNLGGMGEIKANTSISNLKKSRNLSGIIKMQLTNLSIISGFAPQLQAVQGSLNSDLKLSGSMEKPLVSGALALVDFSAEIPEVATKIEDTNLELMSNAQGKMTIEGSARSGNGTLNLSGQLDPASKALTLKIKGEGFQAANSKAIKAAISPDLQIEMNNDGMRVKGEVVIPSAHINAKDAGGEGGTVSVSSDVVVIENGDEEPAKSSASKMYLDVKVVLGDDIRVEVADFSGALKGGLTIQQTPELAPRGTGMIEIVNGEYLVYGQQLNMQRGRVLFGGGPIDNPQLDMDVARDVPAYDVLAGAKIRGTAQAPQLQLYSEPPMPDASILSYMILGQPPGTKGGSYTLGKYLTPDLYVGYSIGLFNAINTFNLRYKLTEKIGLHAASGAASSADLIYTIER